ncbi:endo-alpha-N-acetylgalactosaminidase family protein [Clostridium sp. LIBA-8841]|uniref:endo-alpha-N-acetylgalactosaminidase family protein n=1 Tax=Clostridium sp. LIBA-8841 TaxID=2987530 RepID=UPI002ACE18A2|nr:endo-alpha-N-acetylgalactosaminidase family protein [Clostridium sp. LIBA-8841]
MTRNKFMKKHGLKLTAAIMTSFYGLSLISPKVVMASPESEQEATKNIVGTLELEELSTYYNNLNVSASLEEDIYTKDFEEATDLDGYRIFSGEPKKMVVEDGVFKLANKLWTECRVIDDNSPVFQNAEYEFDFTMISGGQFGVVIRYENDNNYGMICYDGGKWVIQSASGYISVDGPSLQANKKYRMKLKYVDNKLEVYLDGELALETDLSKAPNFPMGEGKIGFRLWSQEKEIHFDNLSYKKLPDTVQEADRIITEENQDTISAEDLVVTIDNKFPNIVRYNKGERSINGTLVSKDKVKINGDVYKPIVLYNKISENKAVYSFDFDDIDLTFDISLEVIDNYVEMKLVNVIEGEDFTLRTLEFLDHNLVTVNEGESVGKLTAAKVTSINNSQDIYLDVSTANVTPPTKVSMGFLNNEGLAVSIENNNIDYSSQVQYGVREFDGNKEIGLWNGPIIYRDVEKGQDSPVLNGDFSAKIVIADDLNKDGEITWHDAGVAYRDIMTKPQYHDMVKDKVSHINMNFASQAQYPFERIVDHVAQYSNYIDGFGQMLLLKGYQSEGHDSGHPDYGNNFNERAGGLEGFNAMEEVLESKYGTKLGVHVNATEAYPEAKYFSNELVGTQWQPGWSWLDQAYLIDKKNDILNNSDSGLLGRLKEMKENAPGIDWVYVDTYWSNPWNEYKVQEFLLENEFAVTTEYSGPFRQNSIWTHWADIAKGSSEYTKGTRSNIIRFVENGMKDVFPHDLHLKGTKHTGFTGWQNEKSLDNVVNQFYTWELPTKYMQNFNILDSSKEEVVFENGLVSKASNIKENNEGVAYEGNHELYKDGNLIYSGFTYKSGTLYSRDNRVFIPWGEDINNPDKIYAWNDFAENREWTLPNSWDGSNEVYLYETSSIGRELVKTIPVVDGKITLTLDSKKPYVLYKEKVENTTESTEWSETSNVRDNGFNSFSFKEGQVDSYGWWEKSSSAENTDHIIFDVDNDVAMGQNYLKVNGTNDGQASQKLTLEGGKYYSASVWAEVSDKSKKRAEIEVVLPDREKVSNYVDATHFQNRIINTDKRGTRFQRIEVEFFLPEGESEITLNLKAGKGEEENSYVRFDNVRVTEEKKSEKELENQEKYYYYEDFETVDEGWGPFTSAVNGECHTHLSETHEGFTDDTIDGQFSLKTRQTNSGLVLRTSPGLLKLEPNSKYKVTFDYKLMNNGAYDFVVRTDEGGRAQEKMDISLPAYEGENGIFEIAFATGDFSDYYIGFERLNGTLVIDNLIVEEYDGEVPDYIPEGADPSIINPTSIRVTASSEETSGENGAAQNASDDDVDTMWHTKYSGGAAQGPHNITLELNEATKINKFRYVPRQSGSNGNITEYKLSVSLDGENFTEIASGNFANNSMDKFVEFEAVDAKFVKLDVINSVGGFASAAELNLYRAEEANEVIGSASIESLEEVKVGENIEVGVGIEELTNSEAWAYDFILNYDENAFDYVETTSKDGVFVSAKKIEDGKVRVLASSLTGEPLPAKEALMKIVLKAEAKTEGTSLSITNSSIGDGEGIVHEIGGAEKTVNIIEGTSTEIIVNPVRDFKESEVNKKDLTVTWIEPETTEGLEGYILYKDGKKVGEISADENSYTFKGLNRHTIYNFKIAAKYSNGEISSKESITLRTAR